MSFILPLPLCMLVSKPCAFRAGYQNEDCLLHVAVGVASLLVHGALALFHAADASEPAVRTQPSVPVANTFIEFNPASPTCYMETNETQSIEEESQLMEQEEPEEKTDGGTRPSSPRHHPVAKAAANICPPVLRFAILAIVAKTMAVLALLSVVRCILLLSESSGLEPTISFAMLVGHLLNKSEGAFALVLLLSLFDTPFSRMASRWREQRDQPCSRLRSVRPALPIEKRAIVIGSRLLCLL